MVGWFAPVVALPIAMPGGAPPARTCRWRSQPGWCVILGASSGFGAAAARAFAAAGLDVAGVHLDRRATLPLARSGRGATSRPRAVACVSGTPTPPTPEQRDAIAAELATLLSGGPRVRVLLHSLAFGTLKPLVAASAKDAVSAAQVAMTLDVMATSLIGWTQALYGAGLFERERARLRDDQRGRYARDSRLRAGRASRRRRSKPRCASSRSNSRRPGSPPTRSAPASPTRPRCARFPATSACSTRRARAIRTADLTTPEDVAGALVALTEPGCGWITGNVIRVDGGEGIAG